MSPSIQSRSALIEVLLVEDSPGDVRLTRESGGPSTFPARVLRCHAAGPVANLELERSHDRERFAAQLSQEEFHRLQPKAGEELFVELKKWKIFSEDYSI